MSLFLIMILKWWWIYCKNWQVTVNTDLCTNLVGRLWLVDWILMNWMMMNCLTIWLIKCQRQLQSPRFIEKYFIMVVDQRRATIVPIHYQQQRKISIQFTHYCLNIVLSFCPKLRHTNERQLELQQNSTVFHTTPQTCNTLSALNRNRTSCFTFAWLIAFSTLFFLSKFYFISLLAGILMFYGI